MKTLTESILGSNGAGIKGRSEQWCKENLLQNNKDWSYTVDSKGVISGDIMIVGKMEQLPDWIKWGEIKEFVCSGVGLKTLKGCPRTVGGRFDCSHNQLKSLEGGPQTVGGGFSCGHNQLKSLEGGPQTVGAHFWCSDNQLTSLKGAPQTVGQDFWCKGNTKKFTEEEVRKYCKVKGNSIV